MPVCVFDTSKIWIPKQDNELYEDPHEEHDDSYEPPPSHRVFSTTPSSSFPRGEYLGKQYIGQLITLICTVFYTVFLGTSSSCLALVYTRLFIIN